MSPCFRTIHFIVEFLKTDFILIFGIILERGSPIYSQRKNGIYFLFTDSFTDAGISKYNGEVTDKTMKELEPWVGEGEVDLGGLDSERSVSILHLY